jgi:RHS repeat-associated protein
MRKRFLTTLILLLLGTTAIAVPEPVQLDAPKQTSQALQRLENTLKQWQTATPNQPQAQVEAFKQQLLTLDTQVQEVFELVEEHLRSHNLPAQILQRQRDSVATYRQELATLLNNLEAITTTSDEHQFQAEVEQTLNHLSPLQEKGKGAPSIRFKPAAEKSLRSPLSNEADLKALFEQPSAALDAAITPEIEALALELEHNPVKIYNWVHDNIQFIPSYGSVQGAQKTFFTKKGNAFDTASLLIALLRSAQIQARYTYGTIQMPASQLMNWIGSVESPEIAMQLLTQGGIPNSAVAEGGQITHIQIEHIWAEAWIDFFPSRGARHRTGDSWIPLDASFKRHQLQSGIDWETSIPFDSHNFATQLENTATTGSDWITDLDEILLQDTLSSHKSTVEQWLIDQGLLSAPLSELLGQATVIPSLRPILAAGLPYEIIAKVETIETLPANLQHHYQFSLFESAAHRVRDEAAFTYSISWPELATQRLSLAFVPAEAVDVEVLESFLPEGDIDASQLLSQIPGYLINFKAELRLNDEVVATAGPFVMGSAMVSETVYTSPTLNEEHAISYPVTGELRSFAWDLQGGMSHALESLNLNNQVNDLLFGSLQTYFAANEVYDQWQARLNGVVAYRAPSHGVARTVLETDFVLGIPQSVSFPGIAFEMERLQIQGVDHRLKRQVGRLSSALASLVLEQAFGDGQTNGISALRALAAALEIGQRVYTLTAENAPTVLPTLELDEQAQELMERLLRTGWQVTIPTGTVTLGSWRGLGTQGIDLESGQTRFPTFGSGNLATGLLYNDSGRLFGWGGVIPTPERLSSALEALKLPVQAMAQGLLPLVRDPLSIEATDNVLTLIAGSLVDLETGPKLPSVLDEHLWSGLLLEHLSLGQLLDPVAPTVGIQLSTTTLVPGESVQISVTAEDNEVLTSLTLMLNESALPLDDNGEATFIAELPGAYNLVATAVDSAGNISRDQAEFLVSAPEDTTAPTLAIHSPADESEITAPTPFVASVQDENLVSWKLAVQSVSVPGETLIATGSQVADNETIATFDPTLLMNGIYQVIFEAEDANGQTSQLISTYSVTGDLKVGHFSFTVEDLSIPMMGMPIRVLRTYDTRRKGESLDFGQGWSVSYQNTKIEESRVIGEGWELNEYGTSPSKQFCIEPIGKPQVMVTLPNGDVETFNAVVTPRCALFQAPPNPVLVFEPESDTFSSLQPLDAFGDDIYFANGTLIDLGSGMPFDPGRYLLTTQAGFKYVLDQTFGIKQVTDPNGNTVAYTENGIIHSAGQSVIFSRDAQGRITTITDPSGNELTYEYDTAGDLVAFTDQVNSTVRYTYNNSHALVDIIDPLDRKLVRNIYDESGRLVAQIDADGHRTDFNHDLEGRQSIVTDRLGRVTQLFYDDEGNVTSQVDALGNVSRFTYDEFGNQLSATDPLGNSKFFEYDDKFNLLSETDEEGNTVNFTYNERGQETSLTDARGNRFELVYDAQGNLLKIITPLGDEIVNTVVNGLVTSTRDALGNVTSYTYDNRGNKLTETDPLGNTITYTYDSNGNQLTESRQRSLVTETTSYQYDSRNRQIQTTDALGNVAQVEYNALGQEVARIDAAGRRTEFEYDVYGNLVETRLPDGTTRKRSYDVEGNLLSSTDAAGQTTRYEYDQLNRKVKVIHSDGSFSRTEYDAVGRMVAQINENGNRTEFAYDKAGHRIQTTNALGYVNTESYDADGNLLSSTDANSNTISYVYDALARRTKTVYPNNLSKESIYDAAGRLIGSKDFAGRETQFEYDANGRLVRVTKFLNATPVTASFAYDEVGNRISQTDANGHATTWTYDSLGQKLSRTLPLGMTETFVYDNQTGNLVSHTDFNAQTTTFSYDPNNDRLLSINYALGLVESFTYNVLGNRLSQTFPDGTNTYTYDNRHRLVKEVKHNNAVLEYGYDNVGNRTNLSFTPANGATTQVQYQYDALSRLQKVIANNGETTYSYDPVGNRQQVSYPNGTHTQYAYDSLNRLLSLEARKPDNSLLASYQYTLAPTGHRTQVVEHSGRVVDYTYDELYRLTEEKITDGGEMIFSYQYDAAGNRVYSIEDGVHTQYTYDANDRLLTQGGATYQYDANGNNIAIEEEGNVVRMDFDGDNRLIGVETSEEGQVTSIVSYAYDADGNRVQTTADGQVTQYVVDNNGSLSQVVAELDQDDQVLVSYLHGDDLISQSRDSATHFYHYDGLGSTRALSSQTATVTDSYDYEAFGELLGQTGSTENNYLYTGEQIDPNTGNYYLRSRFYNPGSGRFLSMDSFEGVPQDPITLHKYLYGNGDPVNVVDPNGLFGLMEFGIANDIRMILSEFQIEFGVNFMHTISDPSAMTPTAMGSVVLFGLAGPAAGKLMRLLSKSLKVCGGNSFTAETLVHTQHGLVPISEVQIGDEVWSYNEETGEQEFNEVVHLIQGEQEYDLVILTLDNGESIEATKEHPFFVVDKGWVDAKALVDGEVLVLKKGHAEITSIVREQRTVVVYNLTLDDAHTYYVGNEGVLVHNVRGNPPRICRPLRNHRHPQFWEHAQPIYPDAPSRLPLMEEVKDKTAGILKFGGVEIEILSGVDGPAELFEERKETLFKKYIERNHLENHVEAHAAAIMRQNPEQGKFAVLYLNNNPCSRKTGRDNGGCLRNLKYMLPRGARLKVIAPPKRPQDRSTIRIFRGKAD